MVSPTRHPRRAFTLIELMMVIVLLGLMAGGVAMSWEAMVPMAKLNSEVRSLAAVLQGTRSDAISRKAEFLVEYDLENERYQVVTPFRTDETGLMRVGDPEEDRLIVGKTTLPEGLEIAAIYLDGQEYTEGRVLVRFDPLGAASDHAVILSQPQFENFYTVEVLALTGLVRFHQGLYTREEPEDQDFQ